MSGGGFCRREKLGARHGDGTFLNEFCEKVVLLGASEFIDDQSAHYWLFGAVKRWTCE